MTFFYRVGGVSSAQKIILYIEKDNNTHMKNKIYFVNRITIKSGKHLSATYRNTGQRYRPYLDLSHIISGL